MIGFQTAWECVSNSSLRIAARFLNNTRSALLEANAYIEPMIRARRADMERFGNDWQDRPVRTPRARLLEKRTIIDDAFTE